jgi:diguanylate cyclase (GGDEF)-like protein
MLHEHDLTPIEPAAVCGPAAAPRSTVYQPAGGDDDARRDPHQGCLVQIYPVDVVEGMLRLGGQECTIGRDPQANLVLADGSVSRRHAEILRGAAGHRLRDLGSTNGTRVNGRAVTDVSLRSGDTIQLGSYIFKYLATDSIESQYHETVYAAMTRDMLTGTYNKRYLLETLDREIARAMRRGTPLSVMMLDIDHFKAVNDTHGHLVGDEVLREFGRRLGTICREDDLVARYGGEEFCFLLAGTPPHEAVAIAERCRRVIEQPGFATAAGTLEITASIGVAGGPSHNAINGAVLLGRADEALYAAKQQGRNRAVLAEPE